MSPSVRLNESRDAALTDWRRLILLRIHYSKASDTLVRLPDRTFYLVTTCDLNGSKNNTNAG